MTIREQYRYPLTPEEIWPYLIRSEVFVTWNPKIRKLHTSGAFAQGAEFWSEYTLHGPPKACVTRVSVVEPNRSLVLEHSNVAQQGGPSGMEVRESFTLTRRGDQTELLHLVRIRKHDFGLFVVILFWLLTTFGTPIGSDELDRLLKREVKAKLGQLLK